MKDSRNNAAPVPETPALPFDSTFPRRPETLPTSLCPVQVRASGCGTSLPPFPPLGCGRPKLDGGAGVVCLRVAQALLPVQHRQEWRCHFKELGGSQDISEPVAGGTQNAQICAPKIGLRTGKRGPQFRSQKPAYGPGKTAPNQRYKWRVKLAATRGSP
jgi:hypothetical protein